MFQIVSHEEEEEGGEEGRQTGEESKEGRDTKRGKLKEEGGRN